MNDKLAAALGYIDQRHIAAAAKKKSKRRRLLTTVAAALVLVFLFNMPTVPYYISAQTICLAADSRKTERPNINSDKFDAWYDESRKRDAVVDTALKPLADFSADASKTVLAGADNVNRVWSPVNAYIALAMTAELGGGHTRQSVLDVLGVNNLGTLRTNISALWEQVYRDDGGEINILANSLWLDDAVTYHQDTMENLAYYYYASAYRGDLGSDATNRDMANWVKNQTGGLMSDRIAAANVTPNSMLALASTVYFQSRWSDEFKRANNTENVFHTADGDVTCTYMNKELHEMNYYWAKDFGAVQLFLKNNSCMWFILPDEDKTVNDVLQSDDYMDLITLNDPFLSENSKWMKVNLSVPKFDISSDTDLEPALQQMGLADLFNPLGNDFTPSVESDYPVFLDSIGQNTRITIDEDGVKAASYIFLDFGAGAAEPPDEIIDFVLNRPFVFAVTTESIPLFVGTVNDPTVK